MRLLSDALRNGTKTQTKNSGHNSFDRAQKAKPVIPCCALKSSKEELMRTKHVLAKPFWSNQGKIS